MEPRLRNVRYPFLKQNLLDQMSNAGDLALVLAQAYHTLAQAQSTEANTEFQRLCIERDKAK